MQPEKCKIKPAGKRLEVRLRKLKTGQTWPSVGQLLQKDQLCEDQKENTLHISDPSNNSQTGNISRTTDTDTVVDGKEAEDIKCDTDVSTRTCKLSFIMRLDAFL